MWKAHADITKTSHLVATRGILCTEWIYSGWFLCVYLIVSSTC